MTESNVERSVHRRTYAEIDLERLKSNFQLFRELFPVGTFICPMVKANAYGHGDVECARALRGVGAQHLGVGLIEEGVRLRQAGDEGSILVFGLFDKESAQTILKFSPTPVISTWIQLTSLMSLLQLDPHKSVDIHLKFNTGMNRLRFDVSDAPKLRKWISKQPAFRLRGICTHLQRGADAGVQEGDTENQLTAFAEALLSFKDLTIDVHALNSSATFNLWARVVAQKQLSQHAFWPLGSRPGISIYGVAPGQDEDVQLDLKPVMCFKSEIVMLHQLKRGEKVSYNGTWQAHRDSVIGVVSAGYADGVMRLLSNKGEVLCCGMRVPIAGTVCMDYFMIDLTDLVSLYPERVAPGEEIVIFGEQQGQSVTAQEQADKVGTIAYEVLTRVGGRVPRTYLKKLNP